MSEGSGLEQPVPVKVLVSLVFGGVAFVASLFLNSRDDRVVLGVAVSLFVAGVAFIVQFLWEVERRLAGMETAYATHAAVTEGQISEGIRKISTATELYSLLEASALSTQATQLVRNSTRIESTPPLVFEFAQSQIAAVSELLRMLGDGADVTYEGEDRDWLLSLARSADATIDATSLTRMDSSGRGVVDDGLWISDLGQRYLDAQRDAIARKVAIRRIFIMDRPELLSDPDFQMVCRLHAEISVAVRVLDPTQIPGIRRGSLFDFVVFDNVLSYQVAPASRVGDGSRPVIINTQLITRTGIVRDRVRLFQDLWLAATDFADATSKRTVPGALERPAEP